MRWDPVAECFAPDDLWTCKRGHPVGVFGKCSQCLAVVIDRIRGMCPAERLEFATFLWKPYTYSTGRRHGPGLITKKQWLALVNAVDKP